MKGIYEANKTLCCLYFILLFVILAAIVLNPLAFQKSNSITEGILAEDIPISGKALDVKTLISSIPYRPNPGMVYTVYPAAKYKRTILEGESNCSNLVFGAAYYLFRLGIDYQIIHLLPRRDFLKGQGHTVLRTRYSLNGRVHIGIVDILEGGMPRSSDKFLDARQLESGSVTNPSILSLNSRKDDKSHYYGLFLDDVTIAYMPANQVNRYFRFIEKIYIPLGNRKIEKYIYDGLAVITGFYPNSYVTSVQQLYADRQLTRFLFILCLWVLRAAILVTPMLILYELRLFKRRYKLRKKV